MILKLLYPLVSSCIIDDRMHWIRSQIINLTSYQEKKKIKFWHARSDTSAWLRHKYHHLLLMWLCTYSHRSYKKIKKFNPFKLGQYDKGGGSDLLIWASFIYWFVWDMWKKTTRSSRKNRESGADSLTCLSWQKILETKGAKKLGLKAGLGYFWKGPRGTRIGLVIGSAD